MKATRTLTFHRMTDSGLIVLYVARSEYDVEELPQDRWLTETQHSAWEWSNPLSPLTAHGGFYDVGKIRRAIIHS